jgi:rhomboid family GlyGly-CTERM serine protease
VTKGIFRELLVAAQRFLAREPIVVAIAVAGLVAALGGDAAREWGRYERDAIEAGQAWRLLTGHIVHLGWGHTALNLTALLLIGLLFEGLITPLEWLAAALVAALAIDAGLYLWSTDVRWYVGLSGVLHGFVAFGAVKLLRARSVLGAVLALGVLGKIVFEQSAGPIPLTASSTGGPVVVAAHLFGALAGALTALTTRTRTRHNSGHGL